MVCYLRLRLRMLKKSGIRKVGFRKSETELLGREQRCWEMGRELVV